MRKADNLPPSHSVVTQSGNLNFLEPSGSVQACNGTALAFFTAGNNRKLVSGNIVYIQSPPILRKYRSHLKTLDARRVTTSKTPSENTQDKRASL